MSPTGGTIPPMAGGPRAFVVGVLPPPTTATAAVGAENLCPHAIFDKAHDHAITGGGDPTLTTTQYKEAWKDLPLDPASIVFHIHTAEAIIDDCQLDNFSIFVKVSKKTVASSFKSLHVCSTGIGRQNTDRRSNI